MGTVHERNISFATYPPRQAGFIDLSTYIDFDNSRIYIASNLHISIERVRKQHEFAHLPHSQNMYAVH